MNFARPIENAELRGGRVRHRLGIVGKPGFAPVPHLLLLHQHALGLTSAELNVFLNIFLHWQDASRMPWVHPGTIAARMGTTQRRITSIINSLRRKGMIELVTGLKRGERKQFDLRPLLIKLEPYAKAWIAEKEAAQVETQASLLPTIEEMFSDIPGVV
jgi:DNA-binding MarR family transcriptional regulator